MVQKFILKFFMHLKKNSGRLEENNGSGKTHSSRVCQRKSYDGVLNSLQLYKEGRSSHLSQASGIHILVLAMKLHKLYNKVLTCISILVPTFIFYIPYFIVKNIH